MQSETILVLTFQSAIVGTGAYVPYIWDIIRRRTRPEKFSWTIWLFNDLLALISQVATQLRQGANANWVGCGLTAAHVAGIVVVFTLSLKYGVSDRSLAARYRNRRMLVGMAVSLLLWYMTEEPFFGLAANITIDVCAVWVTGRKAYADPHSETSSTWAAYWVSGMLAFAAALGGLSFGENASLLDNIGAGFMALAYPVYITVTCLGMNFLIEWRRRILKGPEARATALMTEAAATVGGNVEPLQALSAELIQPGPTAGLAASTEKELVLQKAA